MADAGGSAMTAGNRIPALSAAVLVCAALISGCGGGSSKSSVAVDSVPPSPVAGFAANANDCIISLTWSNPADADFDRVVVRRAVNGFSRNPAAPSSPEDTVIYSGPSQTWSDSGLRNGASYYYTAFALDASGNHSTPARQHAACAYKPFVLAALPDTQYYSLDYPAVFSGQTQWIADNAAAENIKFVFHEGDLTHNNSETEWTNAEAAMGILDGVVPYALCVGNHDDGADRDTSRFNSHFPVSRYEASDHFGGVFEAGKLDNAYYYFSAGGADWLALSLEYDPRDEALAWARGVVEAHPRRRVILVTHALVSPSSELSSIGINIWNNLLRLYPNISLAFNGHYTAGESGLVSMPGDHGNVVHMMFANYQDLLLGGLGYMRIVKLDPTAGTAEVKTYSPLLDEFKTDPGNKFTLSNLDISLIE